MNIFKKIVTLTFLKSFETSKDILEKGCSICLDDKDILEDVGAIVPLENRNVFIPSEYYEVKNGYYVSLQK